MTIKERERERERERYDDEVEICTVEELWYAEIELLSTLESIKSSCNNQKKKATALFGAMAINIYSPEQL